MAIDPKDREAYEQGRELYEDRDNLIGSIIRPISACIPETRFSESEQAAYDKGISGQQLDED
jgi:hypothetical protein